MPRGNSLSDRANLPPLAIVIAAAILALFPLCTADFVAWDDTHNLVRNPRMNPPTLEGLAWHWRNPYKDLYVPLTYTVWTGLAKVAHVQDEHGPSLNPYIFHTANLAIHLASAAFAYLILLRLNSSRWAACLGAILFAIHPLQVEPVGWISGLKDILAGCLGLAAIWQYLVFVDSERRGRRIAHYVAGSVLFATAMLAKPSIVIVPILVAAIDLLWLRRPIRRVALPVIGWLLLAAPIILVGKLVQPAHAVHAESPVWFRPVVALDALAFYLRQLALPTRLGIDYGRSPQWLAEAPHRYVTWIAPAALFLAAGLWMRTRIADPAIRRAPIVGVVVFAAALLPVLGLLPFDFQAYSTVADRYSYVAMLGPAILLAGAIAFAQRCCGPATRRGAIAVAVAVLSIFGVRSLLQSLTWRNSEALFANAVEVNPWSVAGNVNLAMIYADEAERLRRMGQIPAARGAAQVARPLYERALRVSPDDLPANIGLGNVHRILGELPQAATYYRRAVELSPPSAERRTALGAVLGMMGQYDAAVEQFQRALAIDPDFEDARKNLEVAMRMREKGGAGRSD